MALKTLHHTLRGKIMERKYFAIALSILAIAALSATNACAEEYHHVDGCTVCHIMIGETPNLYLIREVITTPNSGDKNVKFLCRTGPNSFADGDTTYDGVCEVCHTDTNHHQNDGTNPDPDHYAGTDCIECHSHFPNAFSHGGGFGSGCEDCHGHDPGYEYEPGKFSEGAGTIESHSTHTENDNDDLKGPNIPCSECHDIENYPYFKSGTGDAPYDLAETNVCDSCHSPGGAFDGVRTAKEKWEEGVYNGTSLKSGEEKWCVGCHDGNPAVTNSVNAPDIGGDGSTYGYFVNGHGKTGWDKDCTDCHNITLAHIDGVERTFGGSYTVSAYNDGYRLIHTDAQPALKIPRSGKYDVNDSRLCFSCHNEVDVLGVPSDYSTCWTDPIPSIVLPAGTTAHTNFRNEQSWGLGWSWATPQAPHNSHWTHLGGNGFSYYMDYNGGHSTPSNCITCHDPHGTSDGSNNPAVKMTRGDLDITFATYNDGLSDYDYAYLGSDDYLAAGPDLHCGGCHVSGAGSDPDGGTRYYRQPWQTPDNITGSSAGIGTPDNLRDDATTSGTTIADGTQWITFDLGATYTVTEVRIHASSTISSEWDVYISTDGSDWGSAVKQNWVVGATGGNTNRWSGTSVTQNTGKYIKLEGTRTSGTAGDMAIHEFDFLGSPGTASWRTPSGVVASYTDTNWSSIWQTPASLVITEEHTGTHTGSTNSGTLTDSSQSWTTNALVGKIVINLADGAGYLGVITSNTANTVTARRLYIERTLDWDTGEQYRIGEPVGDDEFGYPERLMDRFDGHGGTNSQIGATLGWLTPEGIDSSSNLSNVDHLYDDICDYNSDGFAETGATFTSGNASVTFDLGSSSDITGVRMFSSGYGGSGTSWMTPGSVHSSMGFGTPENMLDGDSYTGSTVADDSSTYIIFDLGHTYYIQALYLRASETYPTTWNVYISTDGSNWGNAVVENWDVTTMGNQKELPTTKMGQYIKFEHISGGSLAEDVLFEFQVNANDYWSTWDVSVSEDGNNWFTVESDWTLADRAHKWYGTSFAATPGRYIKLDGTGISGKSTIYEFDYRHKGSTAPFNATFDLGMSYTVTDLNFLIPAGAGSAWDVYVSDSSTGPWNASNRMVNNWIIAAPGGNSWVMASSGATVTVRDGRYLRIEGTAATDDFYNVVVNEIEFSYHNPGEVIDDDINTGSGLHVQNVNHEIVFDMGSTYDVESVQLYSCSSYPSLSTEWDVYVSSSASGEWTPIVTDWTISRSLSQWYKPTTVASGTGRYMKLVGKRTSAAPSTSYDVTMLKEIQFLAE